MSVIFEEARKAITPERIESLFPGGRWKGKEYLMKNPLREDNHTGSFSINNEGLYYDFASKHTGDLIDLISQTKKVSKVKAAEIIAGVSANNNADKWADTSKLPDFFKDRPSSLTPYDINGNRAFVVVRWDDDNKKKILPYYYNGSKWIPGIPVKFKNKRPLYNIDEIRKSSLPVLIVEGEKCVMAAESVLTGKYNVTTWSGGTGSIKATDFSPLIGRDVIIWPDNDSAGKDAAVIIKHKIPSSRILRIENRPDKWDIADAIAGGIDIENFISHCPVQNDGSCLPVVNNQSNIPPEFILRCLENNEIGDADLFVKICSHKVLYLTTTKKWHKWEGGVWKSQNENQIQNMLIEEITNPYLELSRLEDKRIVDLYKNISGYIHEGVAKSEKLRDKLRKHCYELKSVKRLKNILAPVSWKLSISIDRFDNDPLEINLRNGVYCFNNCEFRPHSESDRFLLQAGVSYEPNAKCEFTLKFLRDIFQGDEELISFIQIFFGLTLTGITDHQFLLYCYGNGRNGKSTFFHILKKLLGDYYSSIPIETLLNHKNNSSDDYYRAGLFGKRLVVASEIPLNRKLNESLVKDLTGGERIIARKIYGEPFEFEATHKLCMFGNHLLQLDGTDEGIWRRLLLVEFNYTIPEDKIVPMSQLVEIFEAELPGVLNWAIEGYKKYRVSGKIKIPDSIRLNTKTYRESLDLFRDFIEEYFICEISAKTEIFRIYQEFQAWCDRNKYNKIFSSTRSLIKELEKRGYEVKRGAGNKSYLHGIKLTS